MTPSTWFTRLYDPLMAPIEVLSLRRTRRGLVADAPGLVLEVGAGTGLNLPHYRAASQVIATEPEPAMLRQARRRAAAARVPVRLVVAAAEALPFADGTFDTVVATCVFCTVADPEQGFRELRRVLKPGGELRLLEHIRAASPAMAGLQDRLTPRWSRIAGGCRLNRATLETARRAGFRVEQIRTRFGGVVVQAWLRPA
jgi:ubiquinone/menaquinone biosynthesis C-methylase UbiE